jgi:hypothetical protein
VTTSQAPATQLSPSGHSPQLPPQPSSPQNFALQDGLQFLAKQAAQFGPRVWPQRSLFSSQVSAVQPSPSSQGGGPAAQAPLTCRSSPLQKTPSEQVTSVSAVICAPNSSVPEVACHASA